VCACEFCSCCSKSLNDKYVYFMMLSQQQKCDILLYMNIHRITMNDDKTLRASIIVVFCTVYFLCFFLP